MTHTRNLPISLIHQFSKRIVILCQSSYAYAIIPNFWVPQHTILNIWWPSQHTGTPHSKRYAVVKSPHCRFKARLQKEVTMVWLVLGAVCICRMVLVRASSEGNSAFSNAVNFFNLKVYDKASEAYWSAVMRFTSEATYTVR